MSNGEEWHLYWEKLSRLIRIEKMTDWNLTEASTFTGCAEKGSEGNFLHFLKEKMIRTQ